MMNRVLAFLVVCGLQQWGLSGVRRETYSLLIHLMTEL